MAEKKLGLLRPWSRIAILVPAVHPLVLEQDELISTQTSLVVLNTIWQDSEAMEMSDLQVGPLVGLKTWSIGKITRKKPPAGTGLLVVKVIR